MSRATMGYLNLKRRVGAWCLPARARERSVNIEPREGRQGPGGDRSGETREWERWESLTA